MHATPRQCSGRESVLGTGTLPGMRGKVLEDAAYGILRKARGKRALYDVRFEKGGRKIMMEDNKMEKCCGNCRFHRTGKDAGKNSDFYCNNVDSEGYGLPTDYEDCCEEWEDRS